MNFLKRLMLSNGIGTPDTAEQSIVYGNASPEVAAMIPKGRDAAYYDGESAKLKSEALGKRGSVVPELLFNAFAGLAQEEGLPIKGISHNTDAVLARQYALEEAKAAAEKDAKDAAIKASAPGLAADALAMANDAEANAPAWDKVNATLAARRNALSDATAAANSAMDSGDSRKRLASLAALKIASAAPRMAVELPMSKRADAVSALNPEGYGAAPTREEAFKIASNNLAPVAGEASAKAALEDITKKYGDRTDMAQIGTNLHTAGRELPASAVAAKGFGDKSFYKEDVVDPFALEDYRFRHDLSLKKTPAAGSANGFNETGFDDTDIDSMADDLVHGKVAPSQLKNLLPTGMVGGTIRARVIEAAKVKQPGFSVAKSDSDYNYYKGAGFQKAALAVETFLPNIDRLEAAIQTLPAGGALKGLNSMLIHGGVQIGNVAATNVNMLSGVLASELGASLGGGSSLSDYRVQEALRALNSDAPKEAALASLAYLRQLEVNRHVNVSLKAGEFGKQYLRETYGEETANRLIEQEHAAKKKTGDAAASRGGSDKKTAPIQVGKYTVEVE